MKLFLFLKQSAKQTAQAPQETLTAQVMKHRRMSVVVLLTAVIASCAAMTLIVQSFVIHWAALALGSVT